MSALRLKKLGGLRSSGPIRLACASISLLLALGGSSATLAQSGPHATSAAAPDVMIHSSAAGATPWAEPGPANAVPKWAEPSYKIYLQMKAKAHGGTVRDADHMPDWSGLWTVAPGRGFAWDNGVDRLARGLGPKSAQAILDHCWHGDTPAFPCQGWLLAALTPQYA